MLKPLAMGLAALLLSWRAQSPQILQPRFVVWNVGQGSWATAVLGDHCTHFDMGGEFAPFEKIKALCSDKSNSVFFSHWDWDHISFVKRAVQLLPELCVQASPGGAGNLSKRRILRRLPHCQDSPDLTQEVPYSPGRNRQKKLLSANAQSRIFHWNSEFLITGDSTKEAEQIWVGSSSLPRQNIQWLLLGHHGSKTSTSEELLNHLPKLIGAIASARKKRYGHPHPKVTERLAKRGIPLVKTEDWGNLHFLVIPSQSEDK